MGKKSGFSLVFIIFLAVAAISLIVFVVFAFKYSNSAIQPFTLEANQAKPLIDSTNDTNRAQKEEATGTSEEYLVLDDGTINEKALKDSSNWRTYSNIDFKIQFKYPSLRFNKASGGLEEHPEFVGVGLGETEFEIKKVENTNLNDWYESTKYLPAYKTTKLVPTTVNGLRAYTFDTYADAGTLSYFLIQKGAGLYIISTNLIKEILSPMLNSFVFLD